MGGTPLLGYDVDGQSRLQVNEAEAAQVREIYALFVSNGSLEETLEEIARRGWRRKRWRTRQGKEKGGRAFDRGSLAGLLRNVTYHGQVQHRGKVYGGEQAAIVEAEMWKQAQEGLRRPQKVVRRRHAGMKVRKESTATETAVEQMAAEPVGQVPRISRLMALAIRMEGLVRTARVKDYAELARLGGVSRARVSQVLNLRNLAPPIQERLLFLEGAAGAIHERALRRVLQCDHVFFVWPRGLASNAAGLLVQRSQVFHDNAFLSPNTLKNSGLWTLIAP